MAILICEKTKGNHYCLPSTFGDFHGWLPASTFSTERGDNDTSFPITRRLCVNTFERDMARKIIAALHNSRVCESKKTAGEQSINSACTVIPISYICPLILVTSAGGSGLHEFWLRAHSAAVQCPHGKDAEQLSRIRARLYQRKK